MPFEDDERLESIATGAEPQSGPIDGLREKFAEEYPNAGQPTGAWVDPTGPNEPSLLTRLLKRLGLRS